MKRRGIEWWCRIVKKVVCTQNTVCDELEMEIGSRAIDGIGMVCCTEEKDNKAELKFQVEVKLAWAMLTSRWFRCGVFFWKKADEAWQLTMDPTAWKLASRDVERRWTLTR